MPLSVRASEAIDDLQNEFGQWHRKNFPISEIATYLGTFEEVGEIARIITKRTQGIRGYDNLVKARADIQKEVGDVFIKLMDIAEFEGFSLADAIAARWGDISQRDWTKEDKTGNGYN